MAGILRVGSSLWFSGQVKPVEIPRIDSGHPLTRGLISYWFNPGTGKPIDLISGHIMAIDPSAIQPANRASAFGQGIASIAAATGVHDPSLFPVQSWAHPFSCACGFYQIGVGTGLNAGYFGVSDSGGNDPLFFYQPATTTFGLSIGNAASASNFTFANNTFYVVAGATTGASAWSWWVNGAAQTNGSSTTTFSGSGLGCQIGSSAYNTSGSTTIPNAIVFFGAIWNRQLSVQDAILLYTDPYCFLIPREGEMPMLTTAVVTPFMFQKRRNIWRRR